MQIKISRIVKNKPSNFIADQSVSYWVTVDILNNEERYESMSIQVVIDDKEDLFLTKDIEAKALQKTRRLLDKAISNIKVV